MIDKAFLKNLSRDGYTARQRRQMERLAYYYGTQHDEKEYNFDGTNYDREHRSQSSGKSARYVPLRERRPDTPDTIAKRIVNSFTQLVFSKSMAPRFVSKDESVTEFLNYLIKKTSLIQKMQKARNIGGACGTVVIVPSANAGKLRLRVMNPINIHVVEWEDEDELIPAEVIQQYKFDVETINPDGTKTSEKRWARRVWNQTVSEYYEAKCDGNSDPDWMLIESIEHGLSRCPVVWVQNEPSCDDFDMDGQADYDDRLLDLFDRIDYQWSNINRALSYNLDPTMKVKGLSEDQSIKQIGKGSENALNLGMNGDASYLEAQFPGLQAAIDFVGKLQQNAQNATQCIILDPEKYTGQAQSGEAMQRLMAPMFNRVNVFRDQYENAIRQIVEIFKEIASSVPEAFKSPVVVPKELDYELRWPAFSRPTADEGTKIVNNALAAKGILISSETATTYVAHVFDVDNPQEEIEKLLKEREEQRAELEKQMSSMTEDEDDGGDT